MCPKYAERAERDAAERALGRAAFPFRRTGTHARSAHASHALIATACLPPALETVDLVVVISAGAGSPQECLIPLFLVVSCLSPVVNPFPQLHHAFSRLQHAFSWLYHVFSRL